MAYAAITCLMRTIHQSMELTGCDLQPFYEKLESLRAILEKSSNITGDFEALTSLEAEIAEVAYKTEDMVDSESRKVFLAKNQISPRIAIWKLCFLLKRAVARIGSKMKQWIRMLNRYTNSKDLKEQNLTLASTSQHAVDPENVMVGHETEFEMMLDQLASRERELEVVSIVGMGGIGKTTLATKLYNDPCIMSHFDIRAKATVSQEHCAKNVLLGLLSSTSDETYDELADRLQKLLKGQRYLVFIDDIWTTGAWDDIKLCFPDYNNGSRILLTTRNVIVAEYSSSGKPPYHMRLMNFDEAWSLLYEKVFTKDSFPPEFEQLGEQIALKCGGLPLAITVIAGLLSKIGKALSEWKSVAENVSSAVSADVDVQCMRVLALSYHYLPHHLKPCFLYFALFPEDELIFVGKLLELWAVDGFLKVEEMKSIEEVAEKCLKELTDRSLISIQRSRIDGKIKSCGMHDVTRELCLREAQNMNFVNILRGKSDQNPCTQSIQCSSKSRGRISIHNGEDLARCRNTEAHSVILFGTFGWFLLEFPFKLVRVLDLSSISCPIFPSRILYLIHLRYLALCFYPRLVQYLGSKEEVPSSIIDIPSSISRLCYLQTFILYLSDSFHRRKYPLILPSEILTMPQLRHLHLDWSYLRYYEPTKNSLVLINLQCLYGLNPLYCTGSFFRLFPNLKELQICGITEDFCSRKDLYDFRCLDQLEELEINLTHNNVCFLESISPSGSTPQYPLRFRKKMRGSPPAVAVPSLLLPPPDAFPQNLKNLALTGHFFLPWKDLSIVGKLPKLEVLKLESNACIGEKWEVAEEGFPRLKCLQLNYILIRYWRASSDHFPCLERLFIEGCYHLESIPQDFAEITTLALIDISNCRKSVENSAKQIQQDIQDNYGGSIEFHIRNPFGDDLKKFPIFITHLREKLRDMAYAAITCLMRTIHQSIELTGYDLQPFYEKFENSRAILEKPWKATDNLEALTSLEAEIAEVAYTTEDMFDSESRNVVLAQNMEERSRAMWELFFLLEQALEYLDSTMKKWMATWESMKDLKAQTYSLASLPEHAVERPENMMVGYENEFEMMLDQLAGGERELEVVSIVGMGGIGKTTLATKLYNDPCIMSHFDIGAKVTVSQQCSARNILLGLLSSTSDEPYDQLADRLQKLLKGKRYLGVIDDIWTMGACGMI